MPPEFEYGGRAPILIDKTGFLSRSCADSALVKPVYNEQTHLLGAVPLLCNRYDCRDCAVRMLDSIYARLAFGLEDRSGAWLRLEHRPDKNFPPTRGYLQKRAERSRTPYFWVVGPDYRRLYIVSIGRFPGGDATGVELWLPTESLLVAFQVRALVAGRAGGRGKSHLHGSNRLWPRSPDDNSPTNWREIGPPTPDESWVRERPRLSARLRRDMTVEEVRQALRDLRGDSSWE